jgi:uncharacterized membrane protein HdeD (DUF308 family)
MISPNRLRYKIFTSFAVAGLGVIALARLATSVPFSGSTALAFFIGALLVFAGLWRGLIYLRAARAGAGS